MNPLPVITTPVVPTGPLIGVKPLTLVVGGGDVGTVKAAIAPVHEVETLSVAP